MNFQLEMKTNSVYFCIYVKLTKQIAKGQSLTYLFSIKIDILMQEICAKNFRCQNKEVYCLALKCWNAISNSVNGRK